MTRKRFDIIDVIVAFVLGLLCGSILFSLASQGRHTSPPPPSEASSCSLGTGFIKNNSESCSRNPKRTPCLPSWMEAGWAKAISGCKHKLVSLTGNGVTARRDEHIFTVTAYCQNSCCCGKFADGITASGHIIEPNDCFVAAPPEIPFGTLYAIEGYAGGLPVPVLDRGGAIQGNKIDVFFNSHEKALAWGVQEFEVKQ